MVERIPLFPLGTVLYPGLVLPLHVFEDRYRVLVRRLMDAPDGDRSFGVVAIREGREVGGDGIRALHEVGCTAELRQVAALEGGRYDIVTSGVRRFRLMAVSDEEPYLQGDVRWLDEAAGDSAAVLAGSVGRHFLGYRAALLPGAATDDAELPDNPRVLSYLVAASMVLDVGDKQRLLAAHDDSVRLRDELALLRRERTVLRTLPSLPAVDLVRSFVSPN